MFVVCEECDDLWDFVSFSGVDGDFDCICLDGLFCVVDDLFPCEAVCGMDVYVVCFCEVYGDLAFGDVWLDVVYENVCAFWCFGWRAGWFVSGPDGCPV